MTEQEFQTNAQGAESFRRITDGNENSFWEGYLRGLRRNYHGERFGMEDEHAKWLSLKSEPWDDSRRYRGIGYEMGFEGKPISEAIGAYQKINEEK